jgi:hypothetical protein
MEHPLTLEIIEYLFNKAKIKNEKILKKNKKQLKK